MLADSLSRRRFIGAGLTMFLLLVLPASSWAADLLRDPTGPVGELPPDLPSLRTRAAVVDTKALPIPAKGAQAEQPTITFNLFAGEPGTGKKRELPQVSFTGVVTSYQAEKNGFSQWTGTLREVPEGSFTVVSVRGVVSASIHALEHGEFEIQPWSSEGDDKLHLVLHLDPRKFNMLSPPQIPPDDLPEPEPQPGEDSGDVINVLILYTAGARDLMGGPEGIEATARKAVADTNAALARSGFDGSEGVLKINLSANGVQPIRDYNDSGSLSADLDHITRSSAVRQQRDAAKADQVTLLVGQGDWAGIAWLMLQNSPSFESRAFSVVQARYAGSFTFAHELGHNLGCHHDKQNAGLAIQPYAYGWRFQVDTTFRTIMAYQPGVQSGHFSNPRKTFRGVPTGTANADNVRVILETKRTVANFRVGGDGGGNGPTTRPIVRIIYPKDKVDVRLEPVSGEPAAELASDRQEATGVTTESEAEEVKPQQDGR